MDRGSSNLIIVLVLVVAFSGFIWFIYQSKQAEAPSAENSLPLNQDVLSTETGILAQGEVEGWKTYRNEEYGFEFQYPKEWTSITDFINEPEIAPTLVNKKISDPEHQFRFVIVSVYAKEQTPTFDTSPGKVVPFPGGSGIRYGQNNLNFLTESTEYSIQLLSSHEKSQDEFFSEILATFKFTK